jgi:hypothetical protein
MHGETIKFNHCQLIERHVNEASSLLPLYTFMESYICTVTCLCLLTIKYGTYEYYRQNAKTNVNIFVLCILKDSFSQKEKG